MKVTLAEAVLASELFLLSGERVKSWNLSNDMIAIATSLGQVWFDPQYIVVNKHGVAKVLDRHGAPHIFQFYGTVNPLSRAHIA